MCFARGKRIYTCHNFKILNISFNPPPRTELAIDSYLDKYPDANSIYIGLNTLRKREGSKKGKKTGLKWVFALYPEKMTNFCFKFTCKVFKRNKK